MSEVGGGGVARSRFIVFVFKTMICVSIRVLLSSRGPRWKNEFHLEH